jgi:3-hydroxybutyryl-CoA dehydrogenase
MARRIGKVSVIGVGLMGTQIAIQAACYGCEVKTYDQDPTNFQRTLQRIRPLARPTIPIEDWDKGAEKVVQCKDMGEALKDADLAVEAVYENLEAKRKVFAQMDEMAPNEAILATNSSSIIISRIETATKRPDKCVNLHFYMPAGIAGYPVNTVDVCGGPKTSAETIETCRQWVRSVGCIPLTVKKEVLGFCFNSIWHAIKKRSLELWAEGYVDFRDIDRAWMVFTRMPQGPFGLMDTVGLDVVYDIEMTYYNESKDQRDYPPQALKDMIDRKELGRKTGKGFYNYPDPEYGREEFLRTT